MDIQLNQEQLKQLTTVLEKMAKDQNNVDHIDIEFNQNFGVARYVKAEETKNPVTPVEESAKQVTPSAAASNQTTEAQTDEQAAVPTEEKVDDAEQPVQAIPGTAPGTAQQLSPEVTTLIATFKQYLGQDNFQSILNVLDNDLGKFVIKQFTGMEDVDGLIQQIKNVVATEQQQTQATQTNANSTQQTAAASLKFSSDRDDKVAIVPLLLAGGAAAYGLYKYLSESNTVQAKIEEIIEDLVEKGFIQENQVEQYKQFITNYVNQLAAPAVEQQQQQQKQSPEQAVQNIPIPQSEYNTLQQPRQSSLSKFEWDFLNKVAEQSGQNTISYYLTSGEGNGLINDLVEQLIDDGLISDQYQQYYTTQIANAVAQTANTGYGQADFNPMNMLQSLTGGNTQEESTDGSGGAEGKEDTLEDKSLTEAGNLVQQPAQSQPNNTNQGQVPRTQPVAPGQDQSTPAQSSEDRLNEYRQYLPTATTEQLNDYAARGVTPQQAQWEFMQSDPTIQQLNQTSMQQSAEVPAEQPQPEQQAQASIQNRDVKQAGFFAALITYGPIVYSVVTTILDWLGESDEEVVRTAGVVDKIDKVVNVLHGILNNDSSVAPVVDMIASKLNIANAEQLRSTALKVLEALSEFTSSYSESSEVPSDEPSVEAKINSNTFLIKKGNTSYNELEALLARVANENHITNVESISINVDATKCVVKYAASGGGFDWTNALISFAGQYFQGAGMGESAVHGILNGTAGNTGSMIGGIIGKYFGHEWIGTAVGYVAQELVSRVLAPDTPPEFFDQAYEHMNRSSKTVVDALVSQGMDRNTAIANTLGIGVNVSQSQEAPTPAN
jgi:polyhydroxyalkanoate synthesis regulator phasin